MYPKLLKIAQSRQNPGNMANVGSAFLHRVRSWTGVLAKFLALQLAVQALSAAGGIIVVRSLTKQDYAYFTIANSAMLALIALVNSGVTYGVSAIGGRMWQDGRRLARLISTAHRVSRGPTALALFPIIIMLVWLLYENGGTFGVVALLCFLVAFSAAFQLSYSILIVLPRLRGAFGVLQRFDAIAAAVRLVLLAGAALIFIDTPMVLAIFASVYCGQWLFIRFWVKRNIGVDATVEPEVEAEMRKIVRRQWLNEVYAAFQGQISVFLLSAFGTTAAVADLGALTRFSVIFAALGATMQAVVLPAFARCQDPTKLAPLYLQILGANAIVGFLPIALVVVTPKAFLWLLGEKYLDLSWELLLVAISAGFSLISSTTYGLNTSRAWIYPGWIAVPISIATQVTLILVVGVATLSQVLWMQLLTNAVAATMNIVTAAFYGRQLAGTSESKT